jgi:uncharacterized repeat protein (TIGR03803 family)
MVVMVSFLCLSGGIAMKSLVGWKSIGLFLICLAAVICSPAQTFTKLVSFNNADGNYPFGAVIQGRNGSFYGTTSGGGANGDDGTIYRITSTGRLTTLYSFCSQPNCTDGQGPVGLVLGGDGSLYGTTAGGGDISCRPPFGCGTVFRFDSHGVLTVLHTFEDNDGASPFAGLVQGRDGSFYGTTELGGDLTCMPANGCGTIFKITSSGSLTTLHIFEQTDGNVPAIALVQGTDGHFYGATNYGGNPQCSYGGCGTLFRITSAGAFTTLYKFNGGQAGSGPNSLIQASDENFYGTTFNGDIFELTAGGSESTLYEFTGGGQFGVIPSGLSQGTDGNFYGATFYGGDSSCNPPDGCGTLFKFTLNGILTNLHNFEFRHGAGPYYGILQSTSGSFYGVTNYGGRNASPCPSNGCGTVYNLDMGFGPFVSLVESSGRVGQIGGILGQGFTGTTSVTLNGTPASFTVVSDTFIHATVPSGATSGFVTVATPTGTLTSNIPFTVIP